MGERRTYGSYDDGCAAAHALDLVGERWTMIVVRELLLGPKRFVDLQRDIPGIGPTVLSRRLGDLVAHGLASRRLGAGGKRAEAYELTAWGYRLEAVNTALALWAVESPHLPLDADMSPDTLILTMRAHARPAVGLGGRARVALRLVDSRHTPAREPVSYLATMTARGTTIERTPDRAGADAVLTATTRALKAAVLQSADLRASAEVTLDGDDRAIDQLMAATRLTPTADS